MSSYYINAIHEGHGIKILAIIWLRQTRQLINLSFPHVFVNMIVPHYGGDSKRHFNRDLIIQAHITSNSLSYLILRNLQSLKFKFYFSCKNFCSENNPLYGTLDGLEMVDCLQISFMTRSRSGFQNCGASLQSHGH